MLAEEEERRKREEEQRKIRMAEEARMARESAQLYEDITKSEDFVEKRVSLVIDMGSLKA